MHTVTFKETTNSTRKSRKIFWEEAYAAHLIMSEAALRCPEHNGGLPSPEYVQNLNKWTPNKIWKFMGDHGWVDLLNFGWPKSKAAQKAMEPLLFIFGRSFNQAKQKQWDTLFSDEIDVYKDGMLFVKLPYNPGTATNSRQYYLEGDRSKRDDLPLPGCYCCVFITKPEVEKFGMVKSFVEEESRNAVRMYRNSLLDMDKDLTNHFALVEEDNGCCLPCL